MALSRCYGEIWCSTSLFFLFPSYAWRVITCGSSKCSHVCYVEGPRLIAVFSYRRTYIPASYHIAQELQKYNIPDYRPRQEQYAYRKQILILCTHTIPSVGSKRLSRKFVLFKGCDEIAGSLSARPKTARNKIKRDSFGPTTHPRVLRGPLGIDGDTLRTLLLDFRMWISLFFSCNLIAATGILFYCPCLSQTVRPYTPLVVVAIVRFVFFLTFPFMHTS